MDKNKVKFVNDILIFIIFLIIALSGFILWFVYPAGKNSGQAGIRFLFDRFGWLGIHKWLALAFIILILLHLIFSFSWIMGMFKKTFTKQQSLNMQNNNLKNGKPIFPQS